MGEVSHSVAAEPDAETETEVGVVETPSSTELPEPAVDAGPLVLVDDDQPEQLADTKPIARVLASPSHKTRRTAPTSPKARSPDRHLAPKTLATPSKTHRKLSAEATSQEQHSVAGASAIVPLDAPVATPAITLLGEVSPSVAAEPDTQTETEAFVKSPAPEPTGMPGCGPAEMALVEPGTADDERVAESLATAIRATPLLADAETTVDDAQNCDAKQQRPCRASAEQTSRRAMAKVSPRQAPRSPVACRQTAPVRSKGSQAPAKQPPSGRRAASNSERHRASGKAAVADRPRCATATEVSAVPAA